MTAILLAGCAKEQDVTQKMAPGAENGQSQGQWDGEYLISFRPLTEDSRTRVAVTGSGAVSFEDGDAVLVYVAGDESKYVYDASDGVFKVAPANTPVRVNGSKVAYIYYPYDSFAISSGDAVFTLPSYVTAGSLSDLGDKNPMAAKASFGDTSVQFKNLATIIRVGLLGNKDDVASVSGGTVKLSSSNVALAAASSYTVDWSGTNPAFEANTGSSSADREITVTYTSALDEDTPTYFYFIAPWVADGTIEGLTVTAVNNAKTYTRSRSDLPLGGLRSKMLTMDFRAGLFYDGAGTEDDPYQIKTEDDFRNISRLGTACNTSEFKQVADIDFSYNGEKGDITDNMIGYSGSEINWSKSFRGVYDGDGHKLANFIISKKESDYVGVFSQARSATIKNLTIEDFIIYGKNNSGGIAGLLEGNIINCHTKGTSSTLYAAGTIGGIVGRQWSGTLTGVSNEASIYATGNVGGIAGMIGTAKEQDSGKVPDKYVVVSGDSYNSGFVFMSSGYNMGGIVGYVVAGRIESCRNNGNVVGTSADNLGGIVGKAEICDINTCYSSEKNTSGANCLIKGRARVGGLVGLIIPQTYPSSASNRWNGGVKVINCMSKSFVESTGTANNGATGGLVGDINQTAGHWGVVIANCCNWGGNARVKNSAATGESYVGGLVGYLSGANWSIIDNCVSYAAGTTLTKGSTNFGSNTGTGLFVNYGPIYGYRTGNYAAVRDCFYRSGAWTSEYLGKDARTVTTNDITVINGYSDNVLQSKENASFTLYSSTTSTYTYPAEEDDTFINAINRSAHEAANASNFKSYLSNLMGGNRIYYEGWERRASDGWVFPKALYDKGDDFFSK